MIEAYYFRFLIIHMDEIFARADEQCINESEHTALRLYAKYMPVI
jgi:hypothetical protein